MYSKHTVKGIGVHIYEDELTHLRLLQTDSAKCKLSALRFGTDKPKAIINCSYFTSEYAIGRNHGDVCQNTSSFVDKGWLGFALTKDGYKCGELEWWDVTESVCGFTPSCICIKDGKDVQMATNECGGGYAKKMALATCVSMMGITKEKKCVLVTCEKGLSGNDLKDYLKGKYNLEYLCILDGGGSTEMIVEGNIVQSSTDGTERKMFNGLAFVDEPTEYEKAVLCFRDYKGKDLISCITQKNLEGSHINLVGANDFAGRDATDRVDLLAPCDMVVKAIATYDNTVMFESVDKVQTPSGVSKIWLMCTHLLDSDFKSLDMKVGKIFKKGEPIYCEGNKGIGGGYHIHMEQGLGTFKGGSTPYTWNGQYFTLNGTQYKQYIPCVNGKELVITDVFYLANVELAPRKSTNKTMVDLYPLAQFEPIEVSNEPTEPSQEDTMNARIEELELMLNTERKLRETAELGIKERDEQLEKLKAIIIAIDDLIKGAK